MKINAVGVSSKNIKKTIEFYSLLGFEFEDPNTKEDHVESVNNLGAKLMIDSYEFMKEALKENPKPSNHSSFAILYESPDEVNAVAKKLSDSGYKLEIEPWDAFWGQRYCIVKDPDGYHIDLYAYL